MTNRAERMTSLIRDDMLERLEIVQARRDDYRAKYQVAAQDCETLEKAVELMDRWTDDADQEGILRESILHEDAIRADALREDTVRQETPRNDAVQLDTVPSISTPGQLIRAVSFEGCRNNEDKLVRMAETWGGVVDCRVAAELLINMGLSVSTMENLVSALQKEIGKKERDLWEYVSPRTYRYLPYGEADHKGTDSNREGIKTSFL